jgi:hypothetical protein
MCRQCTAATASILATILAAGATALVSENATKADALEAKGKPITEEDRLSMISTERAVDYAAKIAALLTARDHRSDGERYVEIDQLLRTDPEHRIDPEALVRLASFTHYGALLFESLRNIVITVVQARARSERDAVCVEFALGDEGLKMQRAREDWHDDNDDEILGSDTEIRAVQVPRSVFESLTGQHPKPEPEYTH